MQVMRPGIVVALLGTVGFASMGSSGCARHELPEASASTSTSVPPSPPQPPAEAPRAESTNDAAAEAQAAAAAQPQAEPADEAGVSTSEEPRLGWPADKHMAGVYANFGMIGNQQFIRTLERLAASGMNAVVVDAKDYPGWLSYPSAVPLAVETHAQGHAVLHSLRDVVHEAHSRGIRVILRVACFHDTWMASKRPDMAIKGVADWLNPHSTAAQDYLIAIVDETLSAGVDEVQLDYVRFPTEGLAHADFQLGGAATTDVIAGFVKRVHEHTHAAGVPLSLDVFGVVAWQRGVDVRATGQDLSKLGKIVEVLSPMVYPSHFAAGFNGYASPGDHPEVVGAGTKEAVDSLRAAGSTAIVRPWIQGFPWHCAVYNSAYVSGEIAQAKGAGGVGWLAWNAGGYYGEVYAAAAQQRPAPVPATVATK